MIDRMYNLVMAGADPGQVLEQTPLGRLIKKNMTSKVVPQAPRKPIVRPQFERVDAVFEYYMRTGDLAFLDEN